MSHFVEYTESMWRGMNMRDLKVDEAYLVVKSHYNQPAYLYSRSEECYTVSKNYKKKKKTTNIMHTYVHEQVHKYVCRNVKLKFIKFLVLHPVPLCLCEINAEFYIQIKCGAWLGI